MAEGYARFFGRDRVEASSAGMLPGAGVSRDTIKVMEEEGIDLSGHRSKPLTREAVERADLVVGIGADPASRYPDLLEGKLVYWEIADPFGRSPGRYREIRDRIKEKVLDLLISLGVSDRKS